MYEAAISQQNELNSFQIVGAAIEIVGAAIEIVGAAIEIVGAAIEIARLLSLVI